MAQDWVYPQYCTHLLLKLSMKTPGPTSGKSPLDLPRQLNRLLWNINPGLQTFRPWPGWGGGTIWAANDITFWSWGAPNYISNQNWLIQGCLIFVFFFLQWNADSLRFLQSLNKHISEQSFPPNTSNPSNPQESHHGLVEDEHTYLGSSTMGLLWRG